MGIANGRPLLDRPSRAPTNGRPGFPFGFWVLAGACQRHGVGGFIVQFIIIINIERKHGARVSLSPQVDALESSKRRRQWQRNARMKETGGGPTRALKRTRHGLNANA